MLIIKLILASGSPRRRNILKDLGMEFEVNVPNIEEMSKDYLSPEENAVENALRKAKTIAQKVSDSILIGADTVVALEDTIFNKPKSEEDAMRMLEQLSGKTHRVITGLVFIVVIDGKIVEEVKDYMVTLVKMKSIPNEEIKRYVKENSPFDKAGSYAIQEIGDSFVEGIEGDFYNVVGLPKERVVEILNDLIKRYA
jgi:septum formation protein